MSSVTVDIQSRVDRLVTNRICIRLPNGTFYPLFARHFSKFVRSPCMHSDRILLQPWTAFDVAMRFTRGRSSVRATPTY